MKRKFKALRDAYLKLFYRLYMFCSDYMLILVCLAYAVAFTAVVGSMSFTLFTGLYLVAVYGTWEAEKLLLQSRIKIPTVRKRFTRKEGDTVYVPYKDMEQALLYLYNIENYIEENNLRE